MLNKQQLTLLQSHQHSRYAADHATAGGRVQQESWALFQHTNRLCAEQIEQVLQDYRRQLIHDGLLGIAILALGLILLQHDQARPQAAQPPAAHAGCGG
jgi:hypothetical protein